MAGRMAEKDPPSLTQPARDWQLLGTLREQNPYPGLRASLRDVVTTLFKAHILSIPLYHPLNIPCLSSLPRPLPPLS